MYYSFFVVDVDDDIETGNRSTNSTVGSGERERGQEQDRPLFLHTTGGLRGRNSEDVGLQGFQVFLLLGIMMGYGL